MRRTTTMISAENGKVAKGKEEWRRREDQGREWSEKKVDEPLRPR